MKTLSNLSGVLLAVLFLVSCVKQSYYPLPDMIAFDTQESLPMAIYNTTCYARDENLIVYHLEFASFDFDDSDNYVVEWRVGEQLVGSGAQLHCACGMTVEVLVRNLATGQSGKLRYTLVNCVDIDE